MCILVIAPNVVPRSLAWHSRLVSGPQCMQTSTTETTECQPSSPPSPLRVPPPVPTPHAQSPFASTAQRHVRQKVGEDAPLSLEGPLAVSNGIPGLPAAANGIAAAQPMPPGHAGSGPAAKHSRGRSSVISPSGSRSVSPSRVRAVRSAVGRVLSGSSGTCGSSGGDSPLGSPLAASSGKSTPTGGDTPIGSPPPGASALKGGAAGAQHISALLSQSMASQYSAQVWYFAGINS